MPICTLTAPADRGSVRVTYDPATGEYAILLTLNEGEWDRSPSFGMNFLGNSSLQIGTDRHQLSDDSKTLSVRDSGFGNVLDGLEFNDVAQASTVANTMIIPLDDAAAPVQAFRNCGEAALS